MKTIKLVVLFLLVFSCSKDRNDKPEVITLDKINGIWKWESTCGGITGTCGYSSDLHYSEIIFSNNGIFTEKWNDTVYLTSDYTIVKVDDYYGTLSLDNIICSQVLSEHIDYSIVIIDNKLVIERGDLFCTYSK